MNANAHCHLLRDWFLFTEKNFLQILVKIYVMLLKVHMTDIWICKHLAQHLLQDDLVELEQERPDSRMSDYKPDLRR